MVIQYMDICQNIIDGKSKRYSEKKIGKLIEWMNNDPMSFDYIDDKGNLLHYEELSLDEQKEVLDELKGW